MTTSLGCTCDEKYIEEGLAGILEGLGTCPPGWVTVSTTSGEGCSAPAGSSGIPLATLIGQVQPPTRLIAPQSPNANPPVMIATPVNTSVPVTPTQATQVAQTGGPSGTISTVVTSSDNPVLDWLGLSSTPSAQLINGIPNWALVLAGGFGLYMFGDKK